MDVIIVPLIVLSKVVLNIAYWIVFAYIVFSLLYFFNVINMSNRWVATIYDWLYKLVEPILVHIRKVLPIIGNVDISPMILIFVFMFLDIMLSRILLRF